jgi:hypothetical protein
MSDIDLLEISLLVGENSEILENGKLYALYLAQLNEIKLNSDEPFIVYHRLSDCPNGRFPGRTYPNYQKGEDKKLTESLIAQDLLKNYPIYDGEGLKVEIIDSLSSPGGLRPTTASTARDATENLVMRILKGDFGETKKFKILAQTNQPYIERQTISTQTEATKVFEKHGLLLKGYEIEVEGVGFGCKQDVPTVSSEFAAMLSERWKKATASTDTHSSRSINQLQYQSRDNHYFEDPIPDNLVNEASGIIGIVQTFFDHYLV